MRQAGALQQQPETTRYAYHPSVEAAGAHDLDRIEEAQEWDDVTTQFAELVDGSMRTEFSFGLDPDGKELRGHDGRGMRETSGRYLEKAEIQTVNSPNLGWNLRRTAIEHEETAEVVAMANGEGPNTMIVLSDFPPELWDATEDFGGYNVKRKQTMARFYWREESSNVVHMVTRTLDGSDREALEAIYDELGLEPPEKGELLGQRRRLDLTPEEQEHLDDRATGIYDRKLEEKHGGKWHAGRRPADYRNTYEFVCDQKDIIVTCIELERSGKLTKDMLYNMAATMQKRFEGQQSENVTSVTPGIKTVNRASLSREMISAGQQARSAGMTFSACGGTLSAETDSMDEKLKATGFGKGTEESTAWHGGKIYRNSKCHSCEEVKSEVGACHICKDCVNNPSKRQERYKAYQEAKRPKEKVAHIDEVREAKYKIDNLNSKPETPEELRKKQANAVGNVRLDNVVQFKPRT